MLEITCIDGSVIVTKMHTYDTLGQPNVEVQLSSTIDVATNSRLDQLEILTKQLTEQVGNDLMLRQRYPALQDTYEKYQVMLGLIKDAEESD